MNEDLDKIWLKATRGIFDGEVSEVTEDEILELCDEARLARAWLEAWDDHPGYQACTVQVERAVNAYRAFLASKGIK